MINRMRVVLVTHTPDPDRLCCASAKLCHEPDERDFMEMYKDTSEEHIEKILNMVVHQLHHESVIEHANFTFFVDGVSRALTHQLVRHRVASYSQQSQRYVKMKEPSYVSPDYYKKLDHEKDVESMGIFGHHMIKCWQRYNELIELGWKPEDARMVLPNACTTKIVITMNARELRHFFEMRCTPHAQWEIRAMAKEMLKLCYEVSPILFRDLYKKFIQEE